MRSYIRILNFAVISLMISMTSATFAADSKSDKKSENTESDKLDIQKLEQKYWSAKDDDFTVIQNRAFTKESRFYLSPNLQLPFNDPNLQGTGYGVNAGYYFSEKFGIELNYTSNNYKFNDTVNYFFDRFGALPDFNTYKSSMTVMGYWVPIYAKMSLLDKKIIYFDMGVGLGFGTTTYDQNLCVSPNCTASNKNFTAVSKSGASHYAINIMQQYFLSEHFAVRVDFINKWTNEERLNSSNGTVKDTKMTNDTSLMFGVTYWFSLFKKKDQ